jgi:preprotein translocase subunit SecA
VRQKPVNIALKEVLARDRLVSSDRADITRDTMEKHFEAILAFCIYAYFCMTQKSARDTQLTAVGMFLLNMDRGLIEQVRTGEGKTIIVALLVACKALAGFKVDIITSNKDLANAAVRECGEFYRAVGLTVALNCTDDNNTDFSSYRSDIVYGEGASNVWGSISGQATDRLL